MDTNQTTAQPVYTASPGIFGTKIPAAVAFALGILLFLLPFSEIKCGDQKLMTKSGLDVAMATKWKPSGQYGKEAMGDMTKKGTSEKEGNAQYFAIAALALGVIGLGLSLSNAKSAGTGGLITGLLSGAALIGVMIEMKRWFSDSLAKDATAKTQEGTDSMGLDQLGSQLNNLQPTLGFTIWFYVAVIAFLAAAIFSYLRSRPART